MEQAIQEFINHKKIAVVGASRNGNKFGNMAAKELKQRGYEIFLIHPDAKEIDGMKTYPDLDAVKNLAEAVWINIHAETGSVVLKAAANAGFNHVWLQQGAGSPDLIKLGEELNLDLVSGKCILMYAEPVGSFHKFHQIIWKLIGQY